MIYNIAFVCFYCLKLTKEEGVQAVVTMNEKKELQKNLFGTPITPGKCNK
jgi:hypothetical protein